MSNQVELTLSTISNGDLEKRFQEMYRQVVESLADESAKASIDIKLEFKRVKDTTTMISMSHKIKATYPPFSKMSICQQKDNDGSLLVDKPVIKESSEPLQFATA